MFRQRNAAADICRGIQSRDNARRGTEAKQNARRQKQNWNQITHRKRLLKYRSAYSDDKCRQGVACFQKIFLKNFWVNNFGTEERVKDTHQGVSFAFNQPVFQPCLTFEKLPPRVKKTSLTR